MHVKFVFIQNSSGDVICCTIYKLQTSIHQIILRVCLFRWYFTFLNEFVVKMTNKNDVFFFEGYRVSETFLFRYRT